MTTYIIHIADLHIGAAPNRSNEYRAVFDKLCAAIITNVPPDVPILVTILGDVFHYNTHYTDLDIADFKYLCAQLYKIPGLEILIIPGNHDCNMRNDDGRDLITPVIDPRTTCLTKSGPYTHNDMGQNPISFYHVSVRDPGPIDPAILNDKILLYHGAVEGQLFAKNPIITADHMKAARLTLLGDIHTHQFLEHNAAYPGSLIQQNITESAIKGFIIWKLNTTNPIDSVDPVGTFHPLRNDCGFMQLDIRGKSDQEIDTMLEQCPKNILRAAIICDDTTANMATTARIRNKIGRVDKITCATAVIDPTSTVTNALRQILTSRAIAPERIEDVINVHSIGAKIYTPVQWHIKRLQFDNYFKYGTGNIIDFEPMAGVVSGIIAGNGLGKSSLIDIIFFALYGKAVRCDKNDMMRIGADYMSVRIDFCANNVDYFLLRTDIRNNDVPAHIQLCRIDTIDGAQVPINLTAHDMSNTKKQIASIIGSRKNLLRTGVNCAEQAMLYDITRMKASDRKVMLPQLFGIDGVDNVRDEITSEYKAAISELGKIPRPISEDPIGDYEFAANQHELLTKIKTETLAAAHRLKIKAANCINIDQYNRDLTIWRKSLLSLQSELPSLDDYIEHADYCPQIDVESITQIIQSPQPMSDDIRAELRAIGNIKSYSNDFIREKTRALEQVQLQIVPDPIISARDYLAEIAAIDRELSGLKLMPTDTKYIELLQSNINETSIYKFSPDCSACNHNKSCLNIDQNNVKLAAAIEKRATIIANNQAAISRRSLLEEMRQEITRELNQVRQNATIINRNLQLNAQLCNLRTEIDQYNLDRGKISRSVELEIQLAKSVKYENAISLLEKYNKFIRHKRYLRRQIVINEIEQLTKNISILVAKCPISAEIQQEIAELLNKIPTSISLIDQQLGKLSADITRAKSDIDIQTNYAAISPPIIEKIANLADYIAIIKNPAFKIAITRSLIDMIVNRVNELLTHITNIQIIANTSATTIDFFTIINNIKLPFSVLSASQRFIIGLAFRLSFALLLPKCANFIIIDEGFGCLDPLHINNVRDFLQSVASHYKSMTIITHLPALKQSIQYELQINTVHDCSHISNQGTPLNQVTPFTPFTPPIMPANIKSEKYVCICGKTISKSSKSRHEKSPAHHKRLDKK